MSRVVIFGECMVELVARDENTLSKNFAGDTYNTAVYLKRCHPDCSVSYLTAIGADFLSDELLFKMGEEEINTDHVYRCADRNLGLYMVRTDRFGERTFAYWRKGSAATQTLNLYNQNLGPTDIFYFSGISLAILDEEQRLKLFSLLEQLRENQCQIVFDPNYRPKLWRNSEEAKIWTDKAYKTANLAFPGGDDHLALYGHTDVDAIHAHVSALGVDEIVIKNGAVGVHVMTADEHCIVPVEQVEKVVDTTAAGDAFNAGYLSARLAGQSVTNASSYGAKVAATVISYPGAIVNREGFFSHIRSWSS